MARQIYRKSALERLSSPEQLDSLMQVTTTKGWIALFAVIVVLAGVLTWGFLGRTPDTVGGGGILLREGGIFLIESSGTGLIAEITVEVGDTVEVNDVVAHISDPARDQEIEQAQALLAELEANRRRAAELINENLELQLQSVDGEIDRLEETKETLTGYIGFLEKRVEAQNKAVAAGLITEDVAQATAQDLARSRAELIGSEAELDQERARQASIRNEADTSLFELDQEVDRVTRQLEVLNTRHEREISTESIYAGTIVGMLADEGQDIEQGMPLMQVELTANEINALVFVPLEGSRIKAGQKVQISPEGIAWEEYGYLLGSVANVSDSPISPDAMERLLRNAALVQQFSAGGGVYLVTVKLQMAPAASGQPPDFQWTSSRVPDTHIGTGTLLSAFITVDERRPISLVIPAIRRWLGI